MGGFIQSFNKYLPLIQTGASIAGNVLGGRAQNQAIDRASGINQQATDRAMNTILGLYDQGRDDLAPYRNVGPSALSNLQRLANPGRAMAPVTMPQPSSNALARFGSQTNALGGGPGNVTAAMGQPQRSGKNAAIGGAIGSAAPLGLGLASGALLGGGPGLGLGLGLSALGGPIGLGLGLAGSLIGSQFGKANPYKVPASQGFEQVARNVWGTNQPGIPPEQLTSGYIADALHGRIPVQQAKDLINRDFNEVINEMRRNGSPEHLIQSTIQTQKQYLAPAQQIFDRLGGGQQQPASGGQYGNF